MIGPKRLDDEGEFPAGGPISGVRPGGAGEEAPQARC